MEDKLIEYSDRIVEALESGVDFASEQAPLLIQEVLTYYLVTELIWTVISFLFVVGIGYAYYRFIKAYRAEDNYSSSDEEAMFFGSMFAFIAYMLPVFLFVSSLSTVIKILVAPRLFLIQKLAEIL